MNKIIITIVLLLALAPLRAQQAKAVFQRIPDSVLPLLTSVNRADFVDFLESNMKAQVKNRLGGTSEMTSLTDTYIHIRLSDRSEWEMRLLPLNDSTNVICAVTTVCAPVCDSSVAFYTTADWTPLVTSDFIRLPGIDDFFLLPVEAGREREKADFRRRMDMLLMSARLSESDDTLTFTFNTPQYVQSSADDEADLPDTDDFVRPGLVYRWDSGRFTLAD